MRHGGRAAPGSVPAVNAAPGSVPAAAAPGSVPAASEPTPPGGRKGSDGVVRDPRAVAMAAVSLFR